MSKKTNKKKFFSLTWKAVLAVSIATFTATNVIFIIGKITLDNNYAQERIKTHQFYHQAFNSLLHRSKLHDANISWLIPTLIDPLLSQAEALNQINKLFSANWFKIELESDIESAFLLSNEGDLIERWGDTSADVTSFSSLNNFVVQNEEPLDQIICKDDCVHYFVSPFLHNGTFAGIFIFGINMGETVLQMQGITGANIGIIINRESTGLINKPITSKGLPFKVIALTQAQKNRVLINKLMAKNPESLLTDPIIFDYQEKSYEILTIPFSDKQETAKLIIIDDITKDLAEINKATSLYAAGGLISIMLSAGILFVLLIKPSKRLRTLVSLLPLIAEKKYSEANQFLPVTINNSVFVDEINILDEAIHNLFYKLQKLDLEVEQRTKRLSERTLELQNERNFVSNILNTTQVIIMTLNHQGQILTLNKFGENLLGYSDKELKNQLFTNLIFDNEDFIFITNGLKELETENRNFLRHECLIYSENGTDLYISWFFTLIQNAQTSPEILVVGLDLSERRRIEHKLSWLADHDMLTGLYNRRKFEQELERTLSLATRYKQTGAIIFFDLDQFKYVNDSSGHNIGDELLVKIAEKLLAITRQTDIVARFGGDEFVVLAPQLSQQHAEELIQKVCDEMSTVSIMLEKEKHKVTISAGLLIFPVPGYSEQDLMASVDIAMYKAKDSGRGRWCLASVADLDRADVRKRVNWKSKIETALEDNRFVLYFQPIMRISDRSISRYECLLRLKDEKGGIIPPGMFIDVAEQTGLIHQIDQRVLKLATEHQAEFISRGLDITLSVNLSGDMLSNPHAFDIVMEHITNKNIPIAKFIFEITESKAVTNFKLAQNFIKKINQIGGKFALDDFGVGFSSMNHLKHLPVHYLKIDGSFIKRLSESREDRLFVDAINNVGQGMGIETIAEFVKDDQIFDVLSEIGVDFAQGYAIGKPMPELLFHNTNQILNSKTNPNIS